ncbi:MAG: xanthine dehydrogenase FAD-binding subunit XdhB [Defluviitaleaceae bacterium]|nr:xanthine dehydrogenase FAD-binding subunit XdhB [Defluviitaleaceae bacterium]
MYDFNSYTEARSIGEAVGILCANPNARVISGGTDILIKLRSQDEAFVGRDLVGITRIPQLSGIAAGADGTITIGAATSFTQIERNDIVARHLGSLVKAAASVGGPQVRNTGTIGGNIANGATSADTAGVLFTYDAMLVIHGRDGVREVPVTEFYAGPGKVKLQQGELLAAIKIAREDYEGYCGSYIKFAVRNAMDIATLGCAVLVRQNGSMNGMIEDLRIAFGVAGPTPLRATSAEQLAKGKPITDELLEQVGEKCLESTNARDSWRAAKAFRQQLIRVLPQRAIRQALGIEGGDGIARKN